MTAWDGILIVGALLLLGGTIEWLMGVPVGF